MPGRANIISIITVLERINATLTPSMVIEGSTAIRSAYLLIILDSGKPKARAIRTWFWFKTSIISSPLVVTNIATLVAIGSLMFVVTYFTVAFTNLVFINTTLKEHGFNATLTLKGYAKVILINMFLIVITLGLYLPAAKVRIMKYITSCIELNERGSLDDFIAAEKESVSALGEQLGDVFDFSV